MNDRLRTNPGLRLTSAAIATLAWLGFGLHWRETMVAGALAPLEALWQQALYFTETTNFAAAVAFTVLALRSPSAGSRSPIPGLTVAASLVGVVYWSILYPAHPPRPEGVWSNILIHAITPLAIAGACIAFPGDRKIDTWAPARWMLYPVAYNLYILVRGAFTGRYPYAFNDPTLVGPIRWAATTFVLAIALFAWANILRLMLNLRIPTANGLDRLSHEL